MIKKKTKHDHTNIINNRDKYYYLFNFNVSYLFSAPESLDVI